MNHQNPSRPSRKQRKQEDLPSQINQIQNEENTSNRMQARMIGVTIEGELDYNLDPMEEERDEYLTEELSQEPVYWFQSFLYSHILKQEANNSRNDEESKEFSQEDENDEDNEESFRRKVEILISPGSCFDSSSPGMEEEILSETDGLPHDPASTADSGVYVPPEERPTGLYHFDPYSLKMKGVEEKEPVEEVLEDPVDFEKEFGESQIWKELAEKEKIEVKDFLAGYNMNGKTRGF